MDITQDRIEIPYDFVLESSSSDSGWYIENPSLVLGDLFNDFRRPRFSPPRFVLPPFIFLVAGGYPDVIPLLGNSKV